MWPSPISKFISFPVSHLPLAWLYYRSSRYKTQNKLLWNFQIGRTIWKQLYYCGFATETLNPATTTCEVTCCVYTLFVLCTAHPPPPPPPIHFACFSDEKQEIKTAVANGSHCAPTQDPHNRHASRHSSMALRDPLARLLHWAAQA